MFQKRSHGMGGGMGGGQMYSGVVKLFDPAKGYGHIECNEVKQMFGKDILLLNRYLNGQQVTQGDQVSFSIETDAKGMKATNVMVYGMDQHTNMAPQAL